MLVTSKLIWELTFITIVRGLTLTYIFSGIILQGPDGNYRKCYPVVVSFMVDYPEACQLCLLHTNYSCPICMATKEYFSCLKKRFPIRTVPEMKKIVMKAFAHCEKGENKIVKKILKDSGLHGQTVSMVK